jgi:hypothetical protein
VLQLPVQQCAVKGVLIEPSGDALVLADDCGNPRLRDSIYFSRIRKPSR